MRARDVGESNRAPDKTCSGATSGATEAPADVGDTIVAVKGSMTVRIDCGNTDLGRSLEGDTGADADTGMGSVRVAHTEMAESCNAVAESTSTRAGAAITVPRAERNTGG